MNFFAQLAHTLRYIFRCEGKFDSAMCWWKGGRHLNEHA